MDTHTHMGSWRLPGDGIFHGQHIGQILSYFSENIFPIPTQPHKLKI